MALRASMIKMLSRVGRARLNHIIERAYTARVYDPAPPVYPTRVYDTFAEDQPDIKPVESPKTASELFDAEKKARLSYIARLEKIAVTCVKPDESEIDLEMNKSISTPYACALHISEALAKQSSIAMVDGEVYDMHKPLENQCRIEFLNYKQQDSTMAYWRTGSYIPGYIITHAFKDTADISLKHPVVTPIDSGSFGYDFEATLGDWVPSSTD